MLHLSLYHEHYGVRYAPRGVASWLFYVICLLSILVLPFIIGLAMENFWVETNYFYEMPSVTFTGRCAVRVSTLLGQEYLWTCTDLFRGALQATPLSVLPYFASYEDDKDGDGKVDYANFVLSIPLGDVLRRTSLYTQAAADAPTSPPDSVLEVSFLPEFIYTVNHYLVKVNMTAAPLLRFRRAPATGDVPGAGTTYSWSGSPVCAVTKADMLFHTTRSLINSPYVSYTHTYTSSPLQDLARQPVDLLDLSLFAGAYAGRNQSVVLRPYVEAAGGLDVLRVEGDGVRGLWEDLDDLNAFTWYVQLRIQPAEVQYVPSYAEVLKWGWVQYFVIAYLLQWVLWQLRMVFVKLGLLSSRAVFSVMRRQY
ncbi:Transmembrane protein 231 [Novymonas esmeraldas]|uniref:Transmembrane protein 231 n=1 Tax=Novymonas esmeraldas TaxID=1808958 RepID=A0AAW0FE24_9TRYP